MTGRRAKAPFLPDRITEAEFQSQVIQYARLRGCLVYHTHDSRRSAAGFPDLHITTKTSVIYAELKTLKGRLTKEQAEYIERLKSTGQRVFVWRPNAESWESIRKEIA